MKGKTPLLNYGKCTECRICKSILHWWRECLQRIFSENKSYKKFVEECNTFSLKVEFLYNNITKHLLQSLKSACTRTVSIRKKYLNPFMQSINNDDTTVNIQCDSWPSFP